MSNLEYEKREHEPRRPIVALLATRLRHNKPYS